MGSPDYARLLQQPKVMWVGAPERGALIERLLPDLTEPFELLVNSPSQALECSRVPADVQVVMLDLADMEQPWLAQVLAFCDEAAHAVVIGISDQALSVLPRGVSDFAVLQRLDAWALERLVSLAVLRRAEAFSERSRDLDALTGAVSRATLGRRLESLLAQPLDRERPMLLALIDIDELAKINDLGGERAGDQVLARMGRQLRQTLLVRDTIARVNGGTFAVLSPSIKGSLAVFRVVEKIHQALASALELPYRGAPASYSMGVVVFPDAGLKAVDVMPAAELALRQAKRQHGISCRYFTAGMGQLHERQQSVEIALRRALRREEFALEYQPQVDAVSGRIQRVEALIRWDHRDRGKLAPGEFLSIAEDSGLMTSIGHWATHCLCAQLGVHSDLAVAINLSLAQLNDPTFVDTTLRILAQAGFAADRIQFEVSEATIQFNAAETGRRIRQLSEAGMGFALSGFGDGHINLMQLDRLPISTLKLSRQRVAEMGTVGGHRVAGALIGVAKQLELKIVAEGVETAAQLSQLSSFGVDALQGFLFSPAVDASALQSQLGQADGTRLNLIQALRRA